MGSFFFSSFPPSFFPRGRDGGKRDQRHPAVSTVGWLRVLMSYLASMDRCRAEEEGEHGCVGGGEERLCEFGVPTVIKSGGIRSGEKLRKQISSVWLFVWSFFLTSCTAEMLSTRMTGGGLCFSGCSPPKPRDEHKRELCDDRALCLPRQTLNRRSSSWTSTTFIVHL